MKKILLNTAYFPPIQYFSKIKTYDQIIIEQYEHYGKQSFRNRCDIMTANGIMSLSIPVIKASHSKIVTKETCIDYATPWQKLHFKGIESAYKNSPYYDYYMDDLIPFFTQKEKYLLDLNVKILHKILEILPFKATISIDFTTDYVNTPVACEDFREVIHPKPTRRKFEDSFIAKPYHQTFSERFPFAPNLSILDLLFNEGPDSPNYL